jgi:metallo-beta-lactamase family protein
LEQNLLMTAKLTFLGAAQTVTGSKYLLDVGGARVMFDCGLFQGLKELRLKNWAPLPFAANSIDCVVLTHAHIDHVGYLPRLVNQGFAGPIHATSATVQLTELMLLDSAKIQESDAEYANREGFSKHKPALPLYDSHDAARTVKQLSALSRDEWHAVREPIWIRYHDAGHLLGSCLIEVEIRNRRPPLRLVFSGDVGRYDAPLYHDPQPPPACDYLVCESTYGDREHPEGDMLAALVEVVGAVIRRGGVMLVAAFAVGRAQQLIYLLQVLIRQGRIPEMPIYLDSPMAVDATAIYCDYRAEHDLSEGELGGPKCVFAAPNIHLSRTVEESKAINAVDGPAVIIASSGMMTQGRILHHLRQRLPQERHTIVLGGFQPEGTRGRSLEEGAKYLRMHGRDVPVRAAVTKIPGLSGHADRSELLHWLAPLSPPKQTFLTHGEIASANALAATLRAERDWRVTIPRLGQTVNLE